jgi:hypothetical protein
MRLPISLLARTFVSPCLGQEPKTKVATNDSYIFKLLLDFLAFIEEFIHFPSLFFHLDPFILIYNPNLEIIISN